MIIILSVCWSSYWVIVLLTLSINHSLRFSMIRNFLNAKADNDLIRSSAIISLMSKYLRVIFFRFIIFLIQCQRISMCFVLLWYSELMIKSIALLLSAKINTSWSSRDRNLIHEEILWFRLLFKLSSTESYTRSHKTTVQSWVATPMSELLSHRLA